MRYDLLLTIFSCFLTAIFVPTLNFKYNSLITMKIFRPIDLIQAKNDYNKSCEDFPNKKPISF